MNHLPLGRLEVTGASMEPTLRAGDRLIVVRGLGPLRPAIRVGDLVAVADPRRPERTLVKRVSALVAGGVVVRGDNEGASTDSRHFGPVGAGALRGRVVYRYHPETRRGRLGRRPGPHW
ncbi:MAG TPA: nickel-type superoxide dismutase maturation protease [Acidimicrobiia bacterium]|nr:nickel-type superoxide dismutase maturation protease [Acidimicrobiia bacterium]